MRPDFFDVKNIDDSKLIAGVDEVGRGPLAGPVVAAAVILDKNKQINGLVDSKKLSHNKRVMLAEEIKIKAIDWSLGMAEVDEIDQINIFHASLLAMKRAIETLTVKPEQVLVDGKFIPDVIYKSTAIVKGDSLVPAISAASIIAKVARDMEMMELEDAYPGYGFSSHKGYPTKQHIASLEKLGVTDIHRRSFAPVARLVK